MGAEIGVAVFAHKIPAERSDWENAVATEALFLGREVAWADVIDGAVSGWVTHINWGHGVAMIAERGIVLRGCQRR